MLPRVRGWLAAVCCALTVSSLSLAAETSEDEQVLRAAGLATDGPSLLDFFRKQTADEGMLRRARVLIDQLASDSFRVRGRCDHLTRGRTQNNQARRSVNRVTSGRHR